MGHQPRLQASQSRCDNSSPHTEPEYEGGLTPELFSAHSARAGVAGSSRNGASDVGTVLDWGAMYPHDCKMRIPLTGCQVWGQDDSASLRIGPWPSGYPWGLSYVSNNF